MKMSELKKKLDNPALPIRSGRDYSEFPGVTVRDDCRVMLRFFTAELSQKPHPASQRAPAP